MKNFRRKLFHFFYNNLSSSDGALLYTGDHRTRWNSGDNGDEAVKVDLSKIDLGQSKSFFCGNIEDFERRKQNFGQVTNSYIGVIDDSNGQEIAKYELSEDFSIEIGIVWEAI